LRPDFETSVSIDDVISLDGSISIDNCNVTLSPSHYIGKATTAARSYLPTTAGDAVGIIGSTVGGVADKATKKVADAQNKATDTVIKTRDRASSFLGVIRQRSTTTSSRDDIPVSRPMTPQYVSQFVYDDQIETARSTSTSSEDLSVIKAPDGLSLPDMEAVNDDLENNSTNSEDSAIQNSSDKNDDKSDKEEELCQLVVNILFTIMWRGAAMASKSEAAAAAKERGCVIASINMLALDNANELYKSAVELKRCIVELCIQAVLADMKDNSNSGNSYDIMASAEGVMQWAYDLVVLDKYGNFSRKVSESLLDGVIGLTETLMVFAEGKEDLEWAEMAKMAFDILLCCAEKASSDIEICTMATAKLHALVQTRSDSTNEENAYLMYRLSRIVTSSLDNEEHYSFLVPITKALLEKCKVSMNLTTQLPSLNLRLGGPQFFDHFRGYCQSEEWAYFMEKRILPMHDEYMSGILKGDTAASFFGE
jgi:hypothetical protein